MDVAAKVLIAILGVFFYEDLIAAYLFLIFMYVLDSYFNTISYVCFQLLSLQEPWTLIIDDGLAASFVAPATDSLEDDNQLTSKLP